MGINAYIYKNALGDCTSGGFSSKANKVCIINAEGPHEPDKDCPAVILQSGYNGPTTNSIARAISVDDEKRGGWLMAGGNFIYSSDSRFGDLIKALTGQKHSAPVSVHDRREG